MIDLNTLSMYEKIPTCIFPCAADASEQVAAQIAELIRDKQQRGEKAVLGLATGSTPTGVYSELVRLHTE